MGWRIMDHKTTGMQNGFTLIEVMISLTLGLVVMAALVSTFILQKNTFGAQEDKAERLQTARAAMNIIIQEVMMAGYNPNPSSSLQSRDDSLSTFCGIVHDGSKSELEIRADLNGDGKIVTNAQGSNPNTWNYDENERIVYKKIGNQLKRKTGKGYFQPFAENIKTFEFKYLKADGAMATLPGDVRNVEILIETQTARSGISNEQKTFKLESKVKIRN
ncbi:MAG: prepilin-type N-terminal cleavage/methylation domain-containing protein [Proteobacteria bacterium]|nr:prepilin-type N-terminal cleavage/methylation domain-containing protein [Pseudomonadota bacterium]MBU4472497.1 prepilin-type N-terminal cleavage/methylation domain-containing protein [Pseudomonadota bacterium]MCG2751323.1 prepilin-type N-terminal cleavage/methylation domain-containing protein [Desulfobacteraceae bacterium]